MSATEAFRKRSIEVWRKKHPELMQNLRDDEIFFPVYDQSNRIVEFQFHKIIENPPNDLSYSGRSELYGEAFDFWYSPTTKQTYMTHKLLDVYLSPKFRVVKENIS